MPPKRKTAQTSFEAEASSKRLKIDQSENEAEETYVAYIRAVNVGGRTVQMSDLKVLFESLNFRQVSTFIASGNVIFNNKRVADLTNLESSIEKAFLDRFGYPTEVFVRSIAQVENSIAFSNANMKHEQYKTQLVGFMKSPLLQEKAKLLEDLKDEQSLLITKNSEIYWACKVLQSESKLNGQVMEKQLGIRLTLRGLNTLKRIVDKFKAK
eukprot:Colp12_sorted_trinity150504_noHs@24051